MSRLNASGFGKSSFGTSRFGTSGLSASSFGKSGLLGLTWNGSSPSPLAKPASNGSVLARRAADLAEEGGGCGGRPAAIRWRAPDASPRSEPASDRTCDRACSDPLKLAGLIGGLLDAVAAGWPARGPTGGGPDRSTIVRPGFEEADGPAADGTGDDGSGADAPRGRAGSRPLPPGGPFPELTAYVPTSRPNMAATAALIDLASTHAPQSGHPAGVQHRRRSPIFLPIFDRIPKRNRTVQPGRWLDVNNMAKAGNPECGAIAAVRLNWRRGGKSATRWCRQIRTNWTARCRCRASWHDAAPDQSASPPMDCRD
jgi:hypothetical protein